MTAARCVNCGDFSESAVLIRVIEAGSSPGVTLHACPTCQPRYEGGPDEALQAVRTAVRGHRRVRIAAAAPHTALKLRAQPLS